MQRGPASDSDAVDRREYFRINDHIGLDVSRLARTEPAAHDSADEYLQSLRGELRRLDQELRTNLATLSEQDRLLTALVKSLNGKVDTLARIIAFEQNPMQPDQWQDVTLSEGGVAFLSRDDSIRPGDELAIKMILPPELYQIEALATVLECAPEDQDQYRVHTEFTDLNDSDRQQIARHVMRWQIRQRQQKDEDTSGN